MLDVDQISIVAQYIADFDSRCGSQTPGILSVHQGHRGVLSRNPVVVVRLSLQPTIRELIHIRKSKTGNWYPPHRAPDSGCEIASDFEPLPGGEYKPTLTYGALEHDALVDWPAINRRVLVVAVRRYFVTLKQFDAKGVLVQIR